MTRLLRLIVPASLCALIAGAVVFACSGHRGSPAPPAAPGGTAKAPRPTQPGSQPSPRAEPASAAAGLVDNGEAPLRQSSSQPPVPTQPAPSVPGPSLPGPAQPGPLQPGQPGPLQPGQPGPVAPTPQPTPPPPGAPQPIPPQPSPPQPSPPQPGAPLAGDAGIADGPLPLVPDGGIPRDAGTPVLGRD